jgi:hypothetical protein
MDIAQWTGNLLGQLPGWLFIPAFILFLIICITVWYLYATAAGGSTVWPFRERNEFLDKTVSKRGTRGKK